MLAGKQFDIVLGVDIHIIQPPGPVPPLPIPHPFIGMIFDPISFLPPAPPRPPAPPTPPPSNLQIAGGMVKAAVMQALIPPKLAMIMNPPTGASVYLNGLPHGIAGGSIKATTHIPIGGTFVKPIGNSAEIFMGSKSVLSEGTPLSKLGVMALSCQCIGMPPPPRMPKLSSTPKPPAPPKEPKAPEMGMFLPLSIVMAIPMGRPILVGGFPTIDFMAMAQKILNKIVGNVVGRMKAAASQRIHNAAGAAMERRGMHPNTRSLVHRAICSITGHPIDIATGKVFTDSIDFELPGTIGLQWERVWFSTSTHDGNIGYGWHHNYGVTLGMDFTEKAAALRLPDGRVEIVPFLEEDGAFLLKKDKMSFFRKDNRFGYLDLNSSLVYWFSETSIGEEGMFPLVKIENQYGQNVQFDYTQNGALHQITDSTGRILHVETDKNKRIKAIKTAKPDDATQLFSLIEYDYDALGNLVETRDALGNGLQYRYQNHLLAQETDATGLSFYFKYDGTNEDARCIHTWGDGGIYNHQLAYDLENRCTTVRNSLGFETKHYYNGLGLVTKKVNPDGSFWIKAYSPDAELTFETNELGQSTYYEYDGFGNITVLTRPDDVSLKSTFEAGLLTKYEDAVGGKWAYKYNGERQITERIDPLSRKTVFDYNGETGLLEKITDAIGQETTFEYDDFKNLTTVRMPDKTTSKWTYDTLGRCIEATDAKGNKQRIRYDLTDNILEIQEPDGNIRKLSYDTDGNLIHAKDQQHDVHFSYKGMGKLASRSEAGTRVEFHYDTEEQLIGIRNEKGFAYRFELDALGNVATEIGFDGITRQYRRNPTGQITEILRGAPTRSNFGRNTALVSKYGYDELGQVTEIKHSDNTTETYGYREDGALMLAQNQHSTVRFERDILGKVVKEYQNGEWVASQYDTLDYRIKVQSSFGSKLAFGRNGMGDINNVSANGRTEKWEAEFFRDAVGLETERTMTGGVTSHWKRDRLGRPIEQETLAGGVRRRHRQYTWDVNDRLTQIRDLLRGSNGSAKFGHDALGNLAWAELADGKFEFRMPDAVGNLFKTNDRRDRRYGAAGQLLEAEGVRFDYDFEGNLIKKTEANGKTWLYDWNASGMLETVKRPDNQTVTFTYDALGRRLSKTFQGKTTRWIWDADVPLHEWVERADLLPPQYKAHFDDFKTQNRVQPVPDNITTWVFEPETFSPIAKITDESRYSIVTDHLGTPAAMFDDGGKEVWAIDLSIYGEARNLLGEAEDCPFRYPGQYEDVETGLYYNRFRYYDPKAGVYVSSDPIGLEGNNLNIYAYISDTNKYVDVLGLTCGPANNHVYTLRDKHGNIVYIGITCQDPRARMMDHRRDGKDFHHMEVHASGLTRRQARDIEGSALHHANGNPDFLNDTRNDGGFYHAYGSPPGGDRTLLTPTQTNAKFDNVNRIIPRTG